MPICYCKEKITLEKSSGDVDLSELENLLNYSGAALKTLLGNTIIKF